MSRSRRHKFNARQCSAAQLAMMPYHDLPHEQRPMRYSITPNSGNYTAGAAFYHFLRIEDGNHIILDSDGSPGCITHMQFFVYVSQYEVMSAWTKDNVNSGHDLENATDRWSVVIVIDGKTVMNRSLQTLLDNNLRFDFYKTYCYEHSAYVALKSDRFTKSGSDTGLWKVDPCIEHHEKCDVEKKIYYELDGMTGITPAAADIIGGESECDEDLQQHIVLGKPGESIELFSLNVSLPSEIVALAIGFEVDAAAEPSISITFDHARTPQVEQVPLSRF